jgi:hypothetical protein
MTIFSAAGAWGPTLISRKVAPKSAKPARVIKDKFFIYYFYWLFSDPLRIVVPLSVELRIPATA